MEKIGLKAEEGRMSELHKEIKKIRDGVNAIEKQLCQEQTEIKVALLSQENLNPSIYSFCNKEIEYAYGWTIAFDVLKTRYLCHCQNLNMPPLGARTFASEIRICLTFLYASKNEIWTTKNTKDGFKNIRFKQQFFVA